MNEETTIVHDDLTKIEGIGPAVAEVLNNNGIHTFTDLAGASHEQLGEMMDAAGEGFSFRDSTTWAAQADLAANGRWDELKTWQDELNGGQVVASEEEE